MSSQENLFIGQTAYFGAIGTFFGLAICIAIARTVIRIYTWRRVELDDYFFFVAVVSLVTSSGLFFHVVPKIYFVDTAPEAVLFLEASELIQETKEISIEAYVAEAFAWITIFSVKFSFLFFFRNLIKGVPSLRVMWWCTLAITIPVACVSVVADAIVCPYAPDELLSHCIGGSSFLHREKVVLYYTVVADIVTDALIISIPILLLYKAQFKVKQKISVGIVLCLSTFMIAIGLVRGISAHTHGTSDETWASFWVQLESCICVIMVCVPAFKILFTHSKRSQNKDSPAAGPRYKEDATPTWRAQLFRKKEQFLPEIETGATLSGMRTMIREKGKTVQSSTELTSISQSRLTGSHSEGTMVDSGFGSSMEQQRIGGSYEM